MMSRTAVSIRVAALSSIGAILGVGSTRRLSAVRWGIAGRIVTAWVLTIPGCFVLGYAVAVAMRAVGVHP